MQCVQITAGSGTDIKAAAAIKTTHALSGIQKEAAVD